MMMLLSWFLEILMDCKKDLHTFLESFWHSIHAHFFSHAFFSFLSLESSTSSLADVMCKQLIKFSWMSLTLDTRIMPDCLWKYSSFRKSQRLNGHVRWSRFPLCVAKLKWVTPFTCWAFKLILKTLIGYFPSIQQHQTVLLCTYFWKKPGVFRCFREWFNQFSYLI